MRRHSLIEHTADMGIEASAETIEELFSETAYGLREIVWAEMAALPNETKSCTVCGGDYGELLVNWLNEILYLFEIKGFMPIDFEVKEVQADRLDARISGAPFDPALHPVLREVKAVTYHQLQVEKSFDVWRARVYVDL